MLDLILAQAIVSPAPCVGVQLTQRQHYQVEILFRNGRATKSALDSLLKIQGLLERTEDNGKTRVYRWTGCSPDFKTRGFQIKFRGGYAFIWKGYGF